MSDKSKSLFLLSTLVNSKHLESQGIGLGGLGFRVQGLRFRAVEFRFRVHGGLMGGSIPSLREIGPKGFAFSVK